MLAEEKSHLFHHAGDRCVAGHLHRVQGLTVFRRYQLGPAVLRFNSPYNRANSAGRITATFPSVRSHPRTDNLPSWEATPRQWRRIEDGESLPHKTNLEPVVHAVRGSMD